MKKIISFFKKLWFKLWLKKTGINPVELLQGVQVQKFLENNPRSFDTFCNVLPDCFEVDYETV